MKQENLQKFLNVMGNNVGKTKINYMQSGPNEYKLVELIIEGRGVQNDPAVFPNNTYSFFHFCTLFYFLTGDKRFLQFIAEEKVEKGRNHTLDLILNQYLRNGLSLDQETFLGRYWDVIESLKKNPTSEAFKGSKSEFLKIMREDIKEFKKQILDEN